MNLKDCIRRLLRYSKKSACCLIFSFFLGGSLDAIGREQVEGIFAFYRDGQTFITWKEIEGSNFRYKIYRHTRLIREARDLETATLIGEVGDSSSLNASASFKWTKIRRSGPPNRSKNPVYYIIDERGPLSDDTGLYVYTVSNVENAYYAVTPVIASKERKDIFVGANSTKSPVRERVAPPQPIMQVKTDAYQDFVHWINDDETPGYKAMGRKAGIGYNFRVVFPKTVRLEEGLPLSVYLHGSTVNFNLTLPWRHDEKHSLTLKLDCPVIKGPLQGGIEEDYRNPGWYGYPTKFGKAIGERKPMNRVLWTIDWVEKTFKTDPDRVSLRGSSMGGIGTLALGMMNPERFSVLHPIAPPLSNRDRNGKLIKRLSPLEYISNHPNIEFPMIILTTGRTDQQFMRNSEFALQLLERNLGCIFYWDLRPHSGPFIGTPPKGMKRKPIYWNRSGGEPIFALSSFRRNQSYPVFRNLSIDNDFGVVDFSAKKSDWYREGAGDLIGTINGRVSWDRESIVDTKKRYEIMLQLHNAGRIEHATADVLIRRRQQFLVKPGDDVYYRITKSEVDKVLQEGRAKCDENGLFTIAKVRIFKEGTRLFITK